MATCIITHGKQAAREGASEVAALQKHLLLLRWKVDHLVTTLHQLRDDSIRGNVELRLVHAKRGCLLVERATTKQVENTTSHGGTEGHGILPS